MLKEYFPLYGLSILYGFYCIENLYIITRNAAIFISFYFTVEEAPYSQYTPA